MQAIGELFTASMLQLKIDNCVNCLKVNPA